MLFSFDFIQKTCTFWHVSPVIHVLLMLQHDPVLINEVKECFSLQYPKKYVVDGTLGLGWHARMLVESLNKDDVFIWIDRDRDNLQLAEDVFKNLGEIHPKIHLHHASFAELENILDQEGVNAIDFILYDLGVSSAHYDDGERGFSLRFDAPLDMRFDRTWGKTAKDLIEKLDARELMKIFSLYADEKKAFFIAEAIVKARKIAPIQTTFELLRIIEDASFDKKSPIRVFQALRIAVNEEFEHVESSLRQAIQRLSTWWKILVITFHSIEDRIVKEIFREFSTPICDEITWQIKIPAQLKKVTKKPIEPTEQEISNNPRSRSAKLRIMEKIV